MQYTENYNLNKPELTDVADITKLSDNMDIIDEELEKRTTKSGFLADLITHLASDAAIAISSLSTDSVFYRLLQYALNAAGVQYNFQNANAWYICLGALFGGLIIQGGRSTPTTANEWLQVPLPIALSTIITVVTSCSIRGTWANASTSGFGAITVSATTADKECFWLTVGC